MDLKFRAKANISDEWVYASNIHKVILDDTNEKLWVMHPKGEKIEHLGDGYIKYRPLVVDEETIGQYTGLKDKSGKEIYEGDIVRYNLINEIGVCVFSKFHGVYFEQEDGDTFGTTKGMLSELEVIGNIHENNELLK